MTFKEALQKAKNCTTLEDAKTFIKSIEDDEEISDRRYYDLKHIALDTVEKTLNNKEVIT